MNVPMLISCPLTGKPLEWHPLASAFQPREVYSEDENPAGLNERIRNAGFNPGKYYLFDDAVDVLGHVVKDGRRVGTIIPSRDRGRFGGWQIKLLAEFVDKRVGTGWPLANLDDPVEIEFLEMFQ